MKLWVKHVGVSKGLHIDRSEGGEGGITEQADGKCNTFSEFDARSKGIVANVFMRNSIPSPPK